MKEIKVGDHVIVRDDDGILNAGDRVRIFVDHKKKAIAFDINSKEGWKVGITKTNYPSLIVSASDIRRDEKLHGRYYYQGEQDGLHVFTKSNAL